jgi:hypothetical protein
MRQLERSYSDHRRFPLDRIDDELVFEVSPDRRQV